MSGNDWRAPLAQLLRRRGIADQLLFRDAAAPDGVDRPRDFADLAVILPVAEAWRQLGPTTRTYGWYANLAKRMVVAFVVDGRRAYYNGSWDCDPMDVGEFLARAFLEWGEGPP